MPIYHFTTPIFSTIAKLCSSMQAYLQSPPLTCQYSLYQAPSRSEHPDSTERTSLSVINLRDALIRHHGESHVASDPLERREVEGLCPSPHAILPLVTTRTPKPPDPSDPASPHLAPVRDSAPPPHITCRAATRRISPGTRQASRRAPSGLEEVRRRDKYLTSCLKFGVYKSSCRMPFIFV